MSGRRVKVSIVIPVYNSEKYLRQCLDAIISQTLEDVEVICVNDGSSDGSEKILKEYQERDARIKVVTQPNSGPGAARNRGMEMACGEYLSILDADDWFDPRMLELSYEKAAKTNADICVFATRQYDQAKDREKMVERALNTKLLPRVDVFKPEDIAGTIFQSFLGWAWDKLFRTEFIRENKLRFPDLTNSEDQVFVFNAFLSSARITTLNEVLITQRVGNPESLSNSREKAPLNFIGSLACIKRQLEEKDLFFEYRKSFLNWCVEYALWNIISISESSRAVIIDYLKKEGLFLLGLDTFPARDCYKKKSFCRLRSLITGRPYSRWEKFLLPGSVTLADEIKRPLLSIVVPVYNVEKYLGRCLDSLLALDGLADYEIICVNNGSTDSSAEILDSYKDRFPDLKIIFKEYTSFSPRRNVALDVARGCYVGFVDSDDYVEPGMFRSMLETARKSGSDIVMCQTFVEGESPNSEERVRLSQEYLAAKYSGKKRVRKKFYNNINCCLWNKIYKKSILDEYQVRFPEPLLYEDNVFFRDMIVHARSIFFMKEKFYHYVIREGSVMNTFHHRNSLQASLDHVKIARCAYDRLIRYGQWREWSEPYFRFLHLQILHAVVGFSDEIKAEILPHIRELLLHIDHKQYGEGIHPATRKVLDQLIACDNLSNLPLDWTSLKK